MAKGSNGQRQAAPEDDDAAEDIAQQNVVNDDAAAVSVRVLPQGDGRIYTGDRDDLALDVKDRFPTHARGAVFAVHPAIAAELEARGLVEIQP